MPFLPLAIILEFEPGGVPAWVAPVATLPEVAARTPALAESTREFADQFRRARTDVEIRKQVGKSYDAVTQGLGIAAIDFRREGPVVYTQRDGDYPLGSLGKVMIMYAAFQLREDVRTVIASVPGITTKADLERELKKWWESRGDRWARFVAGSPLPKLDRIFDLRDLASSSRKPIDFIGEKIGVTVTQAADPIRVNRDFRAYEADPDNDAANVAWLRSKGARVEKSYYQGSQEKLIVALELLEMMGDGSTDKWNILVNLDFAERLWMTTLWSDNCCATTCISDIGLPYIQAVMRASGLDKGDGRMSLRGIYQLPVGTAAAQRYPVSPLANRNVEGEPLYRSSDPISDHSGGPVAFARLLIALHEETLVSREASIAMKSILRHLESFGFGSYVERFVDKYQRDPAADEWGKLGVTGPDDIGAKVWYNDAVVFERRSALSRWRYGVVVLGVHTLTEDQAVRQFAEVGKALGMAAGWE